MSKPNGFIPDAAEEDLTDNDSGQLLFAAIDYQVVPIRGDSSNTASPTLPELQIYNGDSTHSNGDATQLNAGSTGGTIADNAVPPQLQQQPEQQPEPEQQQAQQRGDVARAGDMLSQSQQLQIEVARFVDQLVATGRSPQEIRDAQSYLGQHPEEARHAVKEALSLPNHGIHQIINRLVSPDATARSDAMTVLRPFGDIVHQQIGNLIKNQPGGPFVQGIHRLIGDLASINLQNGSNYARHDNASRALDNLRLVAPGAIDRLMEQQLRDPGSALSRAADSMIRALGSQDYRTRERASRALEHIGAPVLNLLQSHLTSSDPEVKRRAEQLIERIAQQHTNRIIDSMMEAGREVLPVGNQALASRFRTLLEGTFGGNRERLMSALGTYTSVTDAVSGKTIHSFQPNDVAEWRNLARAMQRAFDSDARTRGMIARVTPQGNFILGFDQNDSRTGSSLIRVNRDQPAPLSFQTVQILNDYRNKYMIPIPPPRSAEEALRDLFVDPFAEGRMQLHRIAVPLPALPGVVPMPPVNLQHWGPYQTRGEQWMHDTYGGDKKMKMP